MSGALNAQDAVLGPCAPGRDPLGDALAAFSGAPGGPAHLSWEAGLLYVAKGSEPDANPVNPNPSPSENAPFPQPRALGAALLGAQLAMLGSLLAAVSPANQAAILDLMTAAAAGGDSAAASGAGRRREQDAGLRRTAVMCVASAALTGLDALARRCRGTLLLPAL